MQREAMDGTHEDWTTELDDAAAARCEAALHDLGRLPVFDGTVQRILAVVDDPDATNDQLIAALECDATFAANLLRFANSASRSHPIRARSIRQAVMFVGRDALRRLTLETATYRFLERSRGNGRAAYGQMHLHALSVALSAASAADRAGHGGDLAHLAGLLHDVGKLVLPRAFGDEALDAIATAAPGGSRRVALEREELGIDHAQAGALLARAWGMPDAVVAAIAWHHGGPAGDACPSAEVACVQLANVVATMLTSGDADQSLLQRALERAELHSDVLDDLATQAALASATLADGGTAQRIAHLERLAQRDDLTGIANRRHWTRTVRDALETEHQAGCLLLVDVDRFKQVNDEHGHQVGDLVLGEVAHLLQGYGTAGRLGGDEFALWTPVPLATAHAHAVELLDRLAGAFADRPELPAVGLSIGIAHAPTHAGLLDDLVGIADAALYDAKRAGRGRVALAPDPEPLAQAA
ncbi:HDOD domain-containing protein [Conexibacter sp. W3-3-2]|nr:HDOD domain-containing protein [Conexibacter sp. W3-3-2]